MNSPLVSIIIPTYNRLPVICRAIDSVLSQKYSNIECILVDDFSSDGTLEVINQRYYDRVRVYRNSTNRDKSFSRNLGIQNAKGDYIGFLDSDDELTDDSVQQRMQYFLTHPEFNGVVFGMRKDLNKIESRSKVSTYFAQNERLSIESYVNEPLILATSSFLLKKTEMLKYGMYNLELTNKEDIELFLRLLCHLPFVSCGAVVTNVHHDAENRARNDVTGFLKQKNKFSETIKNNTVLMNHLGNNYFLLQTKEHEETLRALYHAKLGTEYRNTYRNGLKSKLSPRNLKFIKRYLFSYFLKKKFYEE